MIEQQSKRQITLFEAVLNNYSTLQRCLMFTCAFLVVSGFVFAERANIASFLFSGLPMGIGLTSNFIAPLVAVGFLTLSCSAYFGIICVSNASPSSQQANGNRFLSELRMTLVFGACFGLLTAILCSLIFVIAEPYLPQAFLEYHQIFGSLDVVLIVLTAIFSSTLYLSVLMLPLSIVLSRLMVFETTPSQVKLTIGSIVISSIILALFMALLVAVITATLSMNLIIFIFIITIITSSTLGLLYWFVGLEASLIANLVYCLLVSYLAHIFL